MKRTFRYPFLIPQTATFQRNKKKQMSAELAHQKADKHLCVALRHKVRIRLHPSKEPVCGIASKNLCRMLPCQENKSKQYGDTTQ